VAEGNKKYEILLWIRFNVPQKFDLEWFKTMGGMIVHGPRPHKVNMG
jgi:cytochrome b subunit of formate dehydrogenase